LGTPVSSTNKTDPHYITEILLKVVLNIFPPHFREIDEPFVRSQLGDVSLTLFILIKDE
jgi:hypothetical protein